MRGHGFKSRWSPEFIFSSFLRDCINCVHNCEEHSSFDFISAVHIYDLFHIHSSHWSLSREHMNTRTSFGQQKRRNGLSCTIYKITVNFSLSLDLEPGTSNPNKWINKLTHFSGIFPPGWTVLLNSPRSFRVFHTNGKRSRSHGFKSCWSPEFNFQASYATWFVIVHGIQLRGTQRRFPKYIENTF